MTMDEILMTKGFGWLFSLLVYASSMYLAYNVGHSKGYTKGFEANPQRNETTMFVTANGNVLRFVPGTDAIVQVRLKDDCIRKITWAEKTDDGDEE